MEIIRTNQVTPRRLHTLLRLAARQPGFSARELLEMLQPPALVSSQETAKEVFRNARQYNLIAEEDSGRVVLHESVGPAQDIESVEGFRALMQRRLLGVMESYQDNYLLNQFTAWYAVQDTWVFQYDKKKCEKTFNEQLHPHESEHQEDGRAFNQYKLNGWLTWAVFLGWGWRMKPFDLLAPDAHGRLVEVLPDLVPESGEMPFRTFAERLARRCPELDGGVLFEQCWQVSRSAEVRGNRLSLMLSTGLRALHEAGKIKLIYRADATDVWQLHPAEGHPVSVVSHIQRR